MCHNSSLGCKTRKHGWTQDLLTGITGRAQIQQRIVKFPDWAEALPSGFKRSRIAVPQRSKMLVCSRSAAQTSGVLPGDVVGNNFDDGHSILLLYEESSNSPIAVQLFSPFLEYHDLLKLRKQSWSLLKEHMWSLSWSVLDSSWIPIMSVIPKGLLSMPCYSLHSNQVFFLTAWPEFLVFITDFIRSTVGMVEILKRQGTKSGRGNCFPYLCLSLPTCRYWDFWICSLVIFRGGIIWWKPEVQFWRGIAGLLLKAQEENNSISCWPHILKDWRLSSGNHQIYI